MGLRMMRKLRLTCRQRETATTEDIELRKNWWVSEGEFIYIPQVSMFFLFFVWEVNLNVLQNDCVE